MSSRRRSEENQCSSQFAIFENQITKDLVPTEELLATAEFASKPGSGLFLTIAPGLVNTAMGSKLKERLEKYQSKYSDAYLMRVTESFLQLIDFLDESTAEKNVRTRVAGCEYHEGSSQTVPSKPHTSAESGLVAGGPWKFREDHPQEYLPADGQFGSSQDYSQDPRQTPASGEFATFVRGPGKGLKPRGSHLVAPFWTAPQALEPVGSASARTGGEFNLVAEEGPGFSEESRERKKMYKFNVITGLENEAFEITLTQENEDEQEYTYTWKGRDFHDFVLRLLDKNPGEVKSKYRAAQLLWEDELWSISREDMYSDKILTTLTTFRLDLPVHEAKFSAEEKGMEKPYITVNTKLTIYGKFLATSDLKPDYEMNWGASIDTKTSPPQVWLFYNHLE